MADEAGGSTKNAQYTDSPLVIDNNSAAKFSAFLPNGFSKRQIAAAISPRIQDADSLADREV